MLIFFTCGECLYIACVFEVVCQVVQDYEESSERPKETGMERLKEAR